MRGGGGNILFHIFYMIYNVYTATSESQQGSNNGIAAARRDLGASGANGMPC
eukprot:SAG31_NODE_3132_length_4639_cov_3.668502_6_plen_52_part_00